MDKRKILSNLKTPLEKKVVKKNVKASVFTHLFSVEKYRRELYLCFHPRYVIDTNQNIYGTKKITLPKTELYVLYTGSKAIKDTSISLKDKYYDIFNRSSKTSDGNV